MEEKPNRSNQEINFHKFKIKKKLQKIFVQIQFNKNRLQNLHQLLVSLLNKVKLLMELVKKMRKILNFMIINLSKFILIIIYLTEPTKKYPKKILKVNIIKTFKLILILYSPNTINKLYQSIKSQPEQVSMKNLYDKSNGARQLEWQKCLALMTIKT